MLRPIARTLRFILRRAVLFLVNSIAAPPEILLVQAVRSFLMRIIGFKVGVNSQFSEQIYVYDGRNFRAGTRCRLGSFCRIWDFSPITVGDNLLASHGLTLISGTHFLDEKRSPRQAPILIGDNVWIGVNVTIVGPTTVGNNVVIGANSLVLGKIEADCIYAGSPARLVRRIDAIQEQDTLLQGDT
jgi:acetyltransferase-like isoleucine patch superfamily enzyme